MCTKSVFGSKGMIRYSVNRSRSFASISGVTLPAPVLRMRRRLALRPLVTPIWWKSPALAGQAPPSIKRPGPAGYPIAGILASWSSEATSTA